MGSHGEDGRPNAQICVSVFGASIVPDRPRLLVGLSNTNHTTGLVRTAGTLAITVLAEGQVGLLEPLGLHSGRDADKLTGLEFQLTAAGDPFFPAGAGVIECAVLEPFSLGDSTLFLCSIRERRVLEPATPLSWAAARAVVGDGFLRRWAEKSAREQAEARQAMLWR